MGIDARIIVYAIDQNQAEKACTSAFARIAELDECMSDYRIESELNRLCRKAGSGPVKVSPDLLKVLLRAQEVARLSNGAFDVTVGPVVRVWRAARKEKRLPMADEIKGAMEKVGWKKMKVSARSQTVTLWAPGMQLDLGGIAKGYACDEAQRVLKRNGVSRALVEMGGDIVVSGPPPGKKGWSIRVPNAGKDMFFTHKSVSSSGDTEQFVEIGGRRYSHLIDPRTGQALTNRIQATVIAKDGLTSDPLTKALSILSKREGLRVVRTYRGTKSYVRSLAWSKS